MTSGKVKHVPVCGFFEPLTWRPGGRRPHSGLLSSWSCAENSYLCSMDRRSMRRLAPISHCASTDQKSRRPKFDDGSSMEWIARPKLGAKSLEGHEAIPRNQILCPDPAVACLSQLVDKFVFGRKPPGAFG